MFAVVQVKPTYYQRAESLRGLMAVSCDRRDLRDEISADPI